jgi:RecA/RadA recombinase
MKTQTNTQTLAQAILAANGVTIVYGGPASGKSTALAGIATAALEAGREVVLLDPLHGESAEFLEALVADLQNDREGTGVYPLVIVEDLQDVAERCPEILQLVKDVSAAGRRAFSMIVTMESPDAGVIPQFRSTVTLAPVGQGISERDARCAFSRGLGPIAHAIHEDLARDRITRVCVVQTHRMNQPEAVSF